MSLQKLIASFILSTSLCASAADITWEDPADASADTDVSLNGVLVEAVNAAATDTNNPTVNGVIFQSRSLLSSNNSVDTFNGTISQGYDLLLSSIDFGTETTLDVGGGNLVLGQTYEIQIWFSDTRNNRVMRYSDQSENSVDLGNGNAQFTTGTFIADGPNQTISLDPQGFDSAHINAYQIRTMGDPPAPAPGAITWGNATDVASDDDISTDGDLVIALNATGNGVTSNPSINGVEFQSTPALLSGSSTVDVFDRSRVEDNNISDNYDELLSSVDFGGSSPTIDLAGSGLLIPGEQYQLQVWFADTRNPNRAMRFSDTQGNSVDLGNGVAQYAIGTFTANSANQELQLLPQNINAAHINAYQVRALSIGDRLLGNFAQVALVGVNTFEITLNFSREVNELSLTESDLIITGGSLVPGSLNGDGFIYSFRITSDATEFTISLPEDSVSAESDDDIMNESASRTFSLDDITPGPIATLFQSLETVSDPYVVTVHFNEAISGLTLQDFVVENGTLSEFVDHTLIHDDNIANYSVTVTPITEGTVTLSLPPFMVTSDSNGIGNSESNTLVTTYELSPRAEINGAKTSSNREFEVFFSFTPHITGFDSNDITITNGSIVSFEMQGRREFADRFYKAIIQAETPGDVTIVVPAGSVANRDHPSNTNSASNIFTVSVTDDFGVNWIVDSETEWANHDSISNLTLSDGFAEPSGSSSGIYSSAIRRFDRPQSPSKLTLTQTPVWGADRWEVTPNVNPPGAGSGAPIFLPIANDDYYFFAQSGGSYHVWHSTDMQSWDRLDQFSGDGFDRATSAEHKDGVFYLLVDTPNDHTPSMFTDTNLNDGQPGTNEGIVIPYANAAEGNIDLSLSSPGGDSALFLDNSDGLFHVFSENHAPIDAPNHSFDSPLANHVTSADGINGFIPQEHLPPIDLRSEPTGNFAFYDHPHVSGSPISNPRPYEIHEGEQEALGDWSLMKVGERYYAFGDYEREVNGEAFLNTGILYGDSLYDSFEIVADVGPDRHPDPTTGFAEGQFYLITQQGTDFISSGPWVDGVQARVLIDTNNDGSLDFDSEWQDMTESYDHTEGYARVITVTPAEIDMSNMPAGYGFQFELIFNDSVVAGSTPIMDRVEMSFDASSFQLWANERNIPANETGDYNNNGIPDLIEFATGQNSLPQLQEDGTLTLITTSEAIEDGRTLELQFGSDLEGWETATEETDGVNIIEIDNRPNGDIHTTYQVDTPAGERQVFWRISAS